MQCCCGMTLDAAFRWCLVCGAPAPFVDQRVSPSAQYAVEWQLLGAPVPAGSPDVPGSRPEPRPPAWATNT